MLEPFKPEDFQPITEDQRTFIVIPYRALHDKGFTIQRMRALLACCSYANHKGTLWPSIEKLAGDLKITKATMQAHVKWLTERGYLMTVNNSYTVGKSAKPRAVVYDEANPPNADDQGELAKDYEAQVNDRKSIKEEKLRLLEPEQSSEKELAKPTSLYQCYRSLLLARFGADLPYQKEIWLQISHRHTLETFKEAASMLINSKGAPPSSPRIFLK